MRKRASRNGKRMKAKDENAKKLSMEPARIAAVSIIKGSEEDISLDK